jgi:hypothetical protein
MQLEPVATTVFNGILEAIKGVSSVQNKIVQNMAQPVPAVKNNNSNTVSLGAIPKRPRADQPAQDSSASLALPAQVPVSNSPLPVIVTPEPQPQSRPITEEERKNNRFRDCIRNAERSTVIFNLDMGRVPVMNKETMSKRATLALSTMAAKIEKQPGTRPTADAVDVIDDVLSLTTNMELKGNEIRTYNNPQDPLRGSFCTVPVKYEFKDSGIRAKAEKVLRKVCGVNCATPYPVIIRECIKQIVSIVKNRYKDNFVRVTVDTRNMVFKVARKPPDDAPDPPVAV